LNKPNVIGIIPARGGSKAVPKKNIRELGGFPIIAYSVVVSQLTKNIGRSIVSTDSQEIADVASQYNADIPFLRPEEFARDESKDIEFFQHAIDWFRDNEGYTPEYWVQIRPTTPLREPAILEKAVKIILENQEATSLVSIHEFPENPGKMFGMQDGYLHGLCPLDPRPEYFALPRQEFAPAYFGNGYVDIVRSSTILKYKSCYGPRMLGFETPDTGELDVESDFKKLDFYLNNSHCSVFEYLKKNFSTE
jgi:CMP-N,N'-diacetyllegionaminic acid synthase